MQRNGRRDEKVRFLSINVAPHYLSNIIREDVYEFVMCCYLLWIYCRFKGYEGTVTIMPKVS